MFTFAKISANVDNAYNVQALSAYAEIVPETLHRETDMFFEELRK